ncbi:sigma-70 family RNA polymerase sigma factor [Candidatus Poribacteria bacterium]|nr:sigma-70 family RNA polymerase sigma factor [Candidatus Poribacteria bacterium]MYH83414.1 sigma-70 family RNA polymerase sigma factor [Candidatus Poribacteria bacterium]
MEKENDVQLIRSILSGNDEAFSVLVRKHQKSIHALAWRKVGDFHIAEEITQDTFLKVYKNLAQLKNPNQFGGWIYVIANNLCKKWHQKNKAVMQSLEATPIEEIEKLSYTHHLSDQRQTEITEDRHELVKKLLAQLPESERTVVTLFYLGEMTAKEIGKFLGVSVNTVKSRLHRGRERLQERQEELLVSETLGGIPFPAQVTERIMQEVANMKPIPPPVGKPLLPWAAVGTAAVLVILLLGASNAYLARFQKPYSFEAQSEPTIEIVDTPIILDIAAKPAVQNRVGRAAFAGKNRGTGTQVSTTTTTSATLEDSAKFSTSQWTQGSAPPGGHVRDIFATSERSVYAVAPTGIYRLGTDAPAWARINTDIPISESLMPMAEQGSTLYIVSTDEIFASDDSGETWRTIGPRPKGHAVGLIIIDEAQIRSSQTRQTMYLALRDEGIYRSTDGGTRWNLFNDGLANKTISTVAAVEKTVFAGTARGLYRLGSGTWKKLPVETSRAIYSLAVSENNLYIGTGPDLLGLTPIEAEQEVPRNESHALKIFHFANLGASWTEITPRYKSYDRYIPSGMKIAAVGEVLLASTADQRHRSTDNGKTWTELSGDSELFMTNSLPVVAVNETTFYNVGLFGIRRTTDGGKSWQLLIDGMVGTRLKDLVVCNDRLYAHNGHAVYQSTDEGASWKKISITERFTGQVATITNDPSKPESARISHFFNSKLVVDDNNLYLISSEVNNLQISRLSTDGSIRSRAQSIPASDDEALLRKLPTGSEAAKEHHSIVPIVPPPISEKEEIARIVVVSNDVFYAEQGRTLFKWRLGDPVWTNTGLTDKSQESYDNDSQDLKLAVSGEILYVGKRDGKLFQSLDGGSSWRDVTPSLPLHFADFREITFVGSTVYVATDEGVLSSETGVHWRVLTDSAGTRPIIDRFAADGSTIYGVSTIGAYRLDTRNQWKQVSSEVLGETAAFAVINDKLFSAIKDRGIFHISLAEE